ncbi:MAG: tetratricopeptide repeat protein, partial [Limisphaerales bacterium]
MMARPSLVLVLLLVLAGGSSVSGGEAPPAPSATGASPPPVAASFEAANRLYEQQQYVEAAHAFETLLRQQPTAAVWFNLGNARLQSGEVGRAIAAYRHARRLEPR